MLVLIGISALIYPGLVDRAPARNRDSGTSSSGTAPIGTTGGESPAIIRELETITGSNDGHELIGRRVDLHVPIQQPINDVAFWIGAGDNRILVVLPSSTSIQAYDGSPVAVSGTIQGLPDPEAMSSWGLTEADREELLQRKIYIRGETAEH